LTKFAVEALHARPEAEAPREFRLRTPMGALALVETRGIGAPALAVTMEELIARGARRFVSVGIAGSLQARLSVGTTVLCTRAIRDEGTSYHYVRSSKYAYPSAPLSARLRRGLETRGTRVRTGVSWTVDAVYRETSAEVRTYRKEGVLTVDMEASDILDVTGWEPRFLEAGTHLQSLLKETVAVLGARPTT
jgi:uridine phosphorylase